VAAEQTKILEDALQKNTELLQQARGLLEHPATGAQ
jgi:hypothetical protein